MIEERLRNAAAAAATWDERRARGVAGAPAAAADDLLALWAEAFAAGDAAALERRLAWDGVTSAEVRRLLADAPPEGALQDWMLLLERAARLARDLAQEPEAPRPGAPPFAAVLLPFARAAFPDASPGRALDGPAREDARERLLARLSEVAAPGLLSLFASYRGTAPARPAFPGFVGHLLRGGLAPLVEELPVLARLLARLAGDAAAAWDELDARLAADAAVLEEAFGFRLPAARLRAGLSDPHRGGRMVAIVVDRAGTEVVYKPRPVGMEAAFTELLAGAAALGAPVPRGARIVDRGAYGWAEAVRPGPLASRAEAEGWFRRAGGLLALSWVAGMKDLHMENVLAAREGPVVIDAEMGLQPARGGPPVPGAFAGARAALEGSFAATGLLGALEPAPGGRLRDVGGISGPGGDAAGARTVVRDADTDAVRLESEPYETAPCANLPLLDGRRLEPGAFAREVEEGFVGAYRAVAGARAAFDARLSALADVPVRILFRPSARYAHLLAVLRAPRYLADGARRSAALDVLNRPFSGAGERPALWPLVAEERAALENLDIPVFTLPAGARAMRTAAGAEVPGVVASSGVDAARARLSRMGPEDERRQVAILRSLLTTGDDRPREDDAAPGVPRSGADGSDDAACDDAALVAAAERIADEILAAAIPGPGGALTWLAAGHLGGREERGAAYYLYGGAAGIAVFLAAAARVTGREDLARAARGAAAPVAAALASPDLPRLVASEPVGGVNGLASLALALAAAGRLVGDPAGLALAGRAAALVTPEALARGPADVEGGAAGAALALLALHEATGDAELVARAAACGERLLATRVEALPGAWGWPDAEGICQAGFAHGSAGVALALGRLAAATGREDFAEGCRAARRHAATLFDAERGTWPALARDSSGGVRPIVMNAWCHGAPGVALACLGLLGSGLADEALLEELGAALAATAAEGLSSLDHLCCGNAGRIEALVAASERLGEAAPRERARALAGAMLARAGSEGRFRFRRDPAGDAAFHPGFFRGLAGIGTALLRVAAPEVVPCLALLEAAPVSAAGAPGEADERDVVAPLGADEASRFAGMTFPAFRHLLALRPGVRYEQAANTAAATPFAVGAFREGRPAGLGLAETAEGSDVAEVLSLFVAPEARGEGLGTRLLLALETEARARGAARLHGVYMTGQPGQAALERVLAKAGWEPPVPRMLTARFSLEAARRTDWYGRYPLTAGLEVFPWTELPADERAALRASQEERGWIKPDLVPWKHDAYGFEPVSSLGVRYRGELVGWVINHALSPALVRFTCSFIRRDLGRRGKLVPVFSESIRRLSERTAFEECTLTVPLLHTGMAGFLRRWCAPLCTFVAETRGTAKRLA